MKKDKNKQNKTIAIVAGVVIGLLLLFVFKGYVYQWAVKYEDAGNRKNYEIKDETLASYIIQGLPNDESLDENIEISQIIDFALKMTDDALDFSIEYSDNEPSIAFKNQGANCVGYAAFTAATGNFLIKRFGLEKEWEAKPKKGKLYLFGNNMHKNAQSGWFKDHDFVIFKNKKTKEEIYVDPTAYDYFGAKRVDKYEK